MRGLQGTQKVLKIQEMMSGKGEIIHYTHGTNLIRQFTGTRKGPTLAITAHHDNVYPEYENCLDNTASVLNLVKIADRLEEQAPAHDVILAWTDQEESCSLDKIGVRHLIDKYAIDYLLDLELTASGSIPVICEYGKFGYGSGMYWDSMIVSPMPFNNASAAWRIGGIKGSACLTLISGSDLDELNNTGYCKRWLQCHQKSDTFDNWYSVVESEVLVDNIVRSLVEYDLHQTS
jgi:hypothetical protein